MTEEQQGKGGFFNWLIAILSTLSSFGGCHKIFRNTQPIHIDTPGVEISSNPHNNISSSSNSQRLRDLGLIPASDLHDTSETSSSTQSNDESGSSIPPNPYDPISKSSSSNPPFNDGADLSGYNPRYFVDPNSVDWKNSNVKSIKSTTDDAAINAARRAEELGLVGEAKKAFMLKAAKEAGYEKRKELTRDKTVIVSAATVDIIAMVSVQQFDDEKSEQQS